jgi:predicted RND superfamily exporter protein
MWQTFGTFILRNRFWLLIALGAITILAAYEATKVQLSYDFAKTVPADDPDYIEYIKFKQTFGEDGSVLAVGIKSDRLFDKEFFNDWIRLTNNVKNIDGVENVLSLGNLFSLQKNDSLRNITLQPLVTGPLKNHSRK